PLYANLRPERHWRGAKILFRFSFTMVGVDLDQEPNGFSPTIFGCDFYRNHYCVRSCGRARDVWNHRAGTQCGGNIDSRARGICDVDTSDLQDGYCYAACGQVSASVIYRNCAWVWTTKRLARGYVWVYLDVIALLSPADNNGQNAHVRIRCSHSSTRGNDHVSRVGIAARREVWRHRKSVLGRERIL